MVRGTVSTTTISKRAKVRVMRAKWSRPLGRMRVSIEPNVRI